MKRLFLPVVSAVLLLTNCSQPSSPTGKLPVVATFYPLAFLAERIGGEFVFVRQITPAGVEPHEYEPSPRDLASVYDAGVFLLNGAGLDPWAEKVAEDVSEAQIVVKMTDHVTLLKGAEQEEHADADVSHDPHVWLDPVLMKKEAELVRDALIQADAIHADAYNANAEMLLVELDTLHASIASGLASCAMRQIVVSHDAFTYLSTRYGFETLALSGLSPEEEPSAQRMAEVAEIARKKQIKYIFFETLVSPKIADTIAREIGAQALVLNPIEGLTAGDVAAGATYLTLMQDNLANLRTALQCL